MEVEDGAESVTLTDDELLPGVEGGGGGSCNAGVKRGRRQRSSTAKERISKMPPCAAGKRSSIYRGVTRHRWTGRYEAHLWDKSTWNQTQNKKGKQVYLGAYDEEEAAARAYDLAALKYWGPGTLINFPVTDYTRDIDEMQNLSREIYLASLRRKSTGFARGLPKFCGEIRDHQNMRWDPQFGRFVTSHTPQGSMELKGASCSSTVNLSRFLQWLQQTGRQTLIKDTITDMPSAPIKSGEEAQSSEEQQQVDDKEAENWPWQFCEPYQLPSLGLPKGRRKLLYPPALSLVLQSSMFQDMLKRVSTRATVTEKETVMSIASNDSIDASAQSPNEPSIHPLKPKILISDSDPCDLDKTMYPVEFTWNKY